ncbi:MAG: transposase [Planctomycetales bacterium]|nr:transposase [Planctomycetales bacterium]
MVLDKTPYQRNDEVMGVATRRNITLMFLPSYSLNLNLIERLWKFVKRRSIYGRCHPSSADFTAAIEQISNTHAGDLASLMTLNFQQFENISLMAA